MSVGSWGPNPGVVQFALDIQNLHSGVFLGVGVVELVSKIGDVQIRGRGVQNRDVGFGVVEFTFNHRYSKPVFRF